MLDDIKPCDYANGSPNNWPGRGLRLDLSQIGDDLFPDCLLSSHTIYYPSFQVSGQRDSLRVTIGDSCSVINL